jgi:hypothetical protein
MSRFTGGLLLAAACAQATYEWPAAYSRTHPQTAYAAAASLRQGCPFVGAPASALNRVWGQPSIRPRGDSAAAVWEYRLKDEVRLEVTVQADTVVVWDVSGMPTARHALRHFAWSMNQARTFPARVTGYLAERADVEPRTAFMVMRACPQPGLPVPALAASWGAPTAVVARGDTTLWIYGYGVEGQHETIAIIADTVRSYWTSLAGAPAASREADAKPAHTTDGPDGR